MKKLKDRTFRRPESFTGVSFSLPSRTIPGQDYTPQEIIRLYTKGLPPQHHYFDMEIDNFNKMSTIEKLDHLRTMQVENLNMRNKINVAISEIEAAKKQAEQEKAEKALKEKLRKEIQQET